MKTKELKPSQVLRKAKKLISDPDKWFKGDYCNVDSEVCQYCSLGAICSIIDPDVVNDALESASEDNYSHSSDPFENILMVGIGKKSKDYLNQAVDLTYQNKYLTIVDVNDDDDVSHEQVLGIFDTAIKLAKKKEK